MKSVFHIITTICRGGAENQLEILVAEQIRQGLDVHVIYLKDKPELKKNFEKVGATVHDELASQPPWLQPFKLRSLLKDGSPIVHAHLPRAELIALFTLRKFKLVVSRHNTEPFLPGAPRLISNFLSRLVEIRCIKIIAISKAVKTYLISRNEVSKSENVVVVYYGYTPKFERMAFSSNHKIPVLKIGTISRLTFQKDIPTMFGAFSEYKKIVKSSSLHILGAGPLESELREKTKYMGISDTVFFMGRSPLVYEFLIELDVFILTSRYEGFGMVLLEAMDVGIPIVASRNSAIIEVLGEKFPGLCQTGNSQDFCEKIRRLNDSEYRNKILDWQRLRLESFSVNYMCESINKIYSL